MSTPEPRTARSLRILYVEDDFNLRSVVAAFLRGRTHRVETAPDGAEGLQMVTTAAATVGGSYDVLITDLVMPEMDGVSLIRNLREAEIRLPVVVYSNFLTPECSQELAALPVQAIIPKGTRPELLASTVTRVAGLTW